ncbi:DUF1302 family protein [Pseudomonas cavernicola]|uniref:DUF1302 family protein n=1 Tax=Pseudomonas cavernicola TaxID=2320866 RepID=A0A418XPD9_9PSED|nr:DUF1302 family protein [Pseudomonas cavernicola]
MNRISRSWGYRTRASLTPCIAWSHDIADDGPNFNEGYKAVSLGLDAEYQTTYSASLSYTDLFGGDYSTLTDRDSVALSFGLNFRARTGKGLES